MLDRVQSSVLRQLFQYWDENCGHRSAPSRDDIDPAQMVEFLSNVFLIDVEKEPRRYRVRLMGTALDHWYGRDLTGCHVDEITDQVLAALDELVMIWEPWLVTGEYEKEAGRVVVYELLAVPLSSDGAIVNMILGGIAQVPLDK